VLCSQRILNLAGLGTLFYLFAVPEKLGVPIEQHEAEAYTRAYIFIYVGILLLILLPPTLWLWLVRIKAKREARSSKN
jgi:cytochrome bd-type quinol oxidase subunit 2